jgi:NAD(P)-dependent dehydrogenase (short-subunit alcohol dehydrogenase family)
MTDQYGIQDPLEQYPKISPPSQRQSEPGLDSELIPLADHGSDTYRGSKRLKGRKALITGGDSGIGRAVAIAYAREGADVAIAYLPAEESDAEQVKEAIEAAGQKAVLCPGDLADEKYCRQLVNDVAKALGGLDIVVNNAGKQIYIEELEQLTRQQVEETFAVNVFAMFTICQEALKYLPKGATIINTASIQATKPSPGLLDYAATKGAITNFTKGLAQQLTPKGIRVNAVAPGPIWTPLQPSFGQPMKKLTKFGQNTPLGRAGQPAELAPLYVFLASQESSYVSGEVIGATGGKLR